MAVFPKVSGTWKEGSSGPAVKVGGAWKNCINVLVRVNGVWRQCYTAVGYGSWSTTESTMFTVPANVFCLRVTCVGGGAGGVTGAVIGSTLPDNATTVFTVGGEATTFGTVTAKGGTDVTAVTTDGELSSYTNSKGFVNGGYKYNSASVHKGDAVEITDYTGEAVLSCGQGGYCDENTSYRHNWYGASGYKTVSLLPVTPGQVITATVGAGGPWWGRGSYKTSESNSNGYGGSPGASGGILVEWGVNF